MLTIQQIVQYLDAFWQKQGCCLLFPYDIEKGAGTFNPTTFLKALGPEPFRAAYVEPSRRPSDGRYGKNPNRLYRFHQYQVILKPSLVNSQELYIESLKVLGLDANKHDIRFIHDDWESPTLGASGLGWEVWCDGMEITQYTYFQQIGSKPADLITCELTYGIERIAMYLQKKESVFDVLWNDTLTYRDLFLEEEKQWSKFHFEICDIDFLQNQFEQLKNQAIKLIEKNVPIAAYDFVLKCSHIFNSLDAKKAISTTQRAQFISTIKHLAGLVATSYLDLRKKLNFPLGTIEKSKPCKGLSFPNDLAIKENLLIEIGTEEIPSSFIEMGIASFEKLVKDFLEKHHIAFEKIETFATPRRLAIKIVQMQNKAQKAENKKGPRLDQAFDKNKKPTKALIGFLKSINTPLISYEALNENSSPVFIQKIKDEEYIFAKIASEEKKSVHLLANEMAKIIEKIHFPKKMRWANFDVEFARPIRWLICMYGDKTLPITFGPITASNITYGHRFLSNNVTIKLDHVDDFEKVLEQNFVIVSSEKRKLMVEKLLTENANGLRIVQKKRLLKEVLHLVEYPFCIEGSFDKTFLDLPDELLISEMVVHQRLFPLEKDKKLTNKFLIIANQKPSKEIKNGNERVILARFNDGKFLFDADTKSSLEDFAQKLKKMVFQKDLGSMYDKTQRIKSHLSCLINHFSLTNHFSLKIDKTKADIAASFCKADLMSLVVQEFPELQGTMGKYYALEQSLDMDIATAIEEHWYPKQEDSSLPSTQLGTILSLADKFDNLIAFFSLGKNPTSSKDPFGLRRQAIGICRICHNKELSIPLKELLQKLKSNFPSQIDKEVIEKIAIYIFQRMKGFLLHFFEKKVIDATHPNKEIDLFDFYMRCQATCNIIKEEKEFSTLIEVFRRTKGQIKDKKLFSLNPSLFQEKAEKELFASLQEAKNLLATHIKKTDYEKALKTISSLAKPLNTLFEEVHILAEKKDLHENRIALLQEIDSLPKEIIDIQKLFS